MKQKTSKWVCCTLVAALTLLLSFFSFNANAQQQAYAVPKDTLLTIQGTLNPSEAYQEQTFTVPAAVKKLTIQCWGAGAAGAYAEPNFWFGAGGGGGAYARVEEIDVTPGETLTIQIGAGGYGNTSTARTAGGSTLVKRGGAILVKAAGAPATTVNQQEGGLGGQVTDCVGDLGGIYTGGKGGDGKRYAGGYAGGGGGAAGSAGNGGNAVDAGYAGGEGGVPGISNVYYRSSNIPGKGGHGAGYVSSGWGAPGKNGNEYGAGGGGGISGTNAYRGGNGANGAIMITFDDCAATAGSINLDTSGCYKTLENAESATGAIVSYFWQKSEDDINWVDIPGATNDNYTPSDTAYYRRGCLTRCDERIYTLSQHVKVGFPTPGFVALSTSSAVTMTTECYDSHVAFDLSVYSCAVPQIKWQKSINKGAEWYDMGTYQDATLPKAIDEPNIKQETWYRAVYKVTTSCEVPTSNNFVLRVDSGVIYRPDFKFDTNTVNIVLQYGDQDTCPYVYTPYFNYSTSIILTNNRSSANEGRLLDTVGTGVYTIDWTVQDCAASRTFTKRYVVSYPDCGGDYRVNDADANAYNTVRYGANCWMKENLKAKHYTAGDSIKGAYVYQSEQHPDTAANLATYGRLYTWHAANCVSPNLGEEPTRNLFNHVEGVCPQGWFIPTPALMAELNNSVSKDLRSTNLWLDGEGTNLSGMTFLPAGCFNGISNRFEDLLGNAYYWTDTEISSSKSYAFWVDCHCYMMQVKDYNKKDAFSVRCVKEKTESLPTVLLFTPSQISMTSAHLTGDVADGGGLSIIESGFCYGTEQNPSLDDAISVQTTNPSVGPFDKDVDGLTTGVVYYVRSYAKNALGVAYSKQKAFTLISNPDSILFDANGGSGVMNPQLVDPGVSTPLTQCVFTYPMSAFKGWSLTEAGEVVYHDRQNITTNGNVKLYAQWYHPTHTAITRVACGSYTWTEGDGQTYKTTGTYLYSHNVVGCTQVDTLYLTINPVYTYTENVSTNTVPYVWRLQSYTQTGTYYDSLKTACCNCDSVYVLNLILNTPIIDTVYFNNNGGEGDMDPQTYTRGIFQTISPNTFTYPLSVFKEWNTEPNGTGTSFDNEENITTIASMTLYAQWYHPQHQSLTETACGSYNWTSGTGSTYAESGTYYHTHTDIHGCTQVDTLYLTVNPVYSFPESYTLSASYTPYVWHGDSLMTTGVYYDSLVTVKGCDSVYTLNLTVTDSDKVAITFNNNGGSGEMTQQKVNINMPTAIKANTFTNSYWYFAGWNTQADGEGTSYADGASITLSAPITLFAQWKTWCTGTPKASEIGDGRIDKVKDHQGNEYAVVQIGGQCWMRENMRATTSPTTGSTIMLSSMVHSDVAKAACWYDNSQSSYGKYGVMYNWCALMDTCKKKSKEVATSDDDSEWTNDIPVNNRRGICPKGWHVPTVSDWSILTTTAGVAEARSGKGIGVGKLAGGNDWETVSYGSSPGNYKYADRNSTGFTALAGGYYGYANTTDFALEGRCTHFWVASNTPTVRCMNNSDEYLKIESQDYEYCVLFIFCYEEILKQYASYVRCIRDAE